MVSGLFALVVAMFDLKKPCKSCPFLKVNGERFGLSKARLQEIFEGPAFQCHCSVDYSEDIEGNETHGPGDNPQQCKGLMSLLAYEGQPNQIMQVAERFGECSVESHKCDGTYQTFQEAIEAHGK